MSASPSPIQKNVQAASETHSASFTKGHLALPPAKKYLVLTCMDARIDPAKAFGIELGDAHVIRNAGASTRDALRSIVISEQLLGTQEIVLVKHTGCGMLTFTNDDAYGLVDKNLGPEATAELKSRNVDFLPFSDLEQAIKVDIKYLQDTKLVPDSVTISGWIYEVETGRTRRVV
ncbi:carbonate dehydratase [Capronia epimyces CBS 606.96]|uniref:Carbonic anhydrase n=1 Tax=Capronia epimyces CBS 606.96 TaxID=1182542 RepID=W9ZEI8_9EURO|nr:carbonate dehydratase [Capronia epimyces CBS 606.96]EXJ92899.1 carbonate dehydratase [Capronia epimyces CBS 606.96]